MTSDDNTFTIRIFKLHLNTLANSWVTSNYYPSPSATSSFSIQAWHWAPLSKIQHPRDNIVTKSSASLNLLTQANQNMSPSVCLEFINSFWYSLTGSGTVASPVSLGKGTQAASSPGLPRYKRHWVFEWRSGDSAKQNAWVVGTVLCVLKYW